MAFKSLLSEDFFCWFQGLQFITTYKAVTSGKEWVWGRLYNQLIMKKFVGIMPKL